MRTFLENLVKQFVEKPESVQVEEETGQLLIRAEAADLGTIIGKEGKTIRALRNLVNLKSARSQIENRSRYEIKVDAKE